MNLDNDHLRINEVLSYGDERDWFELYNPTPQRIDLDKFSSRKKNNPAMFLMEMILLSPILQGYRNSTSRGYGRRFF